MNSTFSGRTSCGSANSPCAVWRLATLALFLVAHSLAHADVTAHADVAVLHADSYGLDLEVTTPLRVDTLAEESEAASGGRALACVRVGDWPVTTTPGEPELPYLVVPLVIPPMGSAQAMVVSREDTSVAVGEVTRAEEDRAIGLEEAAGGPLPPSVSEMPSATVSVEAMGISRDVRMARLVVRPVEFVGGRVTWAKRLRIAVRFTSPPLARPARLASEPISQHPAGFAINADQIEAFRLPSEPSPRARVASLPTRPRIYLYIRFEGIYRVTGEDLLKWGRDAGLDFSRIDPRTFRLELRGQEVPIYVEGEQRGFVDEALAIEFYARPNIGRYQAIAPDLYRDPYVDMGIYILSWGERFGARLAEEDGSITVPLESGNVTECFTYRQTVHAERDGGFYELGGILDNYADFYLWDIVETAQAKGFPIELESPVESYETPPTLEVMGRGGTFSRHIAEFRLQGARIGTAGLDKIVRDIDLIHYVKTADENLHVALVDGTNKLEIITGDPTHPELQSSDAIYLNWFEVTYDRTYHTRSNYISFRRPSRPTSGVFDFTITGFTTPDITIYKVGVSRLTNVTVQQMPATTTGARSGYQVRFQDQIQDDDPQYLALTSSKKLKPSRAEVALPWSRSLKDQTRQSDYLIICHPTLVDTVKRLAEYRRSQAGGGYNVTVVNVRQIYDEFDDGYPTPTAIQDFIRYASRFWSAPSPQYVVLVGAGIIKFTDEWVFNPAAFIPTLQETVVKWGITGSDHGYSLVVGDDALPDLYVGRIPARDNTSLKTAIDKIIQFEQSPVLEPWRNSILLIADGPEFVPQHEFLSSEIPPRYTQSKFYHMYINNPSLEVFGGRRTEMQDYLNRGTLWTIYLGHGGGGIWSYDQLLTFQDPLNLTNLGRAGIFLSMTCFTGAFDVPKSQCLGELMLFAPGGGIAWWGATGVGWINNDFYLAQSVVRAGLRSSKESQTLGAILTATKIDYLMRYSGPQPPRGSFPHALAYMYNLLGDPALRVTPPPAKMHLNASTRTPVLGQPLSVTGTLPEATTGNAWISLYDARQYPVFAPLEAPVSNGAFTANLTVPVSLWGTSLTLKSYAASAGAQRSDWSGVARLAVSETLIDSVVVARPSRDSITVSAAFYSTVGVKAAVCSLVVNSEEVSDVVPMVPADGANRYRTVRPFDLSALPRTDPLAFVQPVIKVTDQRDRVTVRQDIPPIYPNSLSRLRISSMQMAGTSRAEILAMLSNVGEVASDSVVVSTWLMREGTPVQLLDEQRVTPLAPQSSPIPSDQDIIVLEKATRSSSTSGEQDTFLPQIVRLVIPLPDTLVRGRTPGAQVFLTSHSVDGRATGDTATFVVPSSFAVFNPQGTAAETLRTSADQFLMEVRPNALSGPTLIKISSMASPAQQGQPDLNVPGAKIGHPTPACEVKCLAPVQVVAPEVMNLTLAIDKNDTIFQQALAQDQLRIGYWNADRCQWELLPLARHTWAPDKSWVSVSLSRDGVYGFVQVDDRIPPTIEVSARGQQFGEGAYISPQTKFLVLVEDRNGVSTAPGDIEAWIDDVPFPDSTISIPTQATSLTAVAITLTPPLLLPREAPYQLRVTAHDAVGNAAEYAVRFRVAQQTVLDFYGNYPNPFGAEGTVFAFAFSTQISEVIFRVYDVSGRQIIRFSNYDMSQLYPDDPPALHQATVPHRILDRNGLPLIAPSYHEVVWPGRDAKGNSVANGVYFGIVTVRDESGSMVAKHTFTMVKAE